MIQITDWYSGEVFLFKENEIEMDEIIIKRNGRFFGYTGYFTITHLENNQLKLF